MFSSRFIICITLISFHISIILYQHSDEGQPENERYERIDGKEIFRRGKIFLGPYLIHERFRSYLFMLLVQEFPVAHKRILLLVAGLFFQRQNLYFWRIGTCRDRPQSVDPGGIYEERYEQRHKKRLPSPPRESECDADAQERIGRDEIARPESPAALRIAPQGIGQHIHSYNTYEKTGNPGISPIQNPQAENAEQDDRSEVDHTTIRTQEMRIETLVEIACFEESDRRLFLADFLLIRHLRYAGFFFIGIHLCRPAIGADLIDSLQSARQFKRIAIRLLVVPHKKNHRDDERDECRDICDAAQPSGSGCA